MTRITRIFADLLSVLIRVCPGFFRAILVPILCIFRAVAVAASSLD